MRSSQEKQIQMYVSSCKSTKRRCVPADLYGCMGVPKFHKNPEVKLRMAPIEFKGLLGALVPQAKGFVLNPNGVNLILSREQLTAITKKFS